MNTAFKCTLNAAFVFILVAGFAPAAFAETGEAAPSPSEAADPAPASFSVTFAVGDGIAFSAQSLLVQMVEGQAVTKTTVQAGRTLDEDQIPRAAANGIDVKTWVVQDSTGAAVAVYTADNLKSMPISGNVVLHASMKSAEEYAVEGITNPAREALVAQGFIVPAAQRAQAIELQLAVLA